MTDATSTHPVGRLAGRFYSDRRLIVLTIVLALASGASSLLVLPRMEDPMLSQRAANITTAFPGADAERVEALVTEKIEDKLLDIPEIKRMRSQSRAGASFISIELRDDVYDTDPVWSAIRGKLEDSISFLPEGAYRPEFNELDIAAYAWIGAIVWDRPDEKESSGVLRRLARELKDRMFALSGSKDVDLFGDPLEEIVVEISPEKAASVGLSAASIAQQLRRGDVKSSAGMLRGNNAEIVVEIQNQFHNVGDILDASIQTHHPGQTLLLSDLATVHRGAPEPPAARALVDGRPAVIVSVMLRPEYRIDRWSSAAKVALDTFRSQLPQGVGLEVIMEQNHYVADRMWTLARNLFLGVAAVALVTFLFMGWRSSLLVTATLPIASLMVVAGMRFLGIPIHQMSITGLIIALGLLIDNAIIAADEIELSLRRGHSPKAAVVDMVSRLFAPLLASTVTTALAFAPMALMEGPAGEFVGSISITVMLAIFSSLFLSMTVLPAVAAMLQQGQFPNCLRPARSMAEDDTSVPQGRGEKTGSENTGARTSFFRRLARHGLSFPRLTRLYRQSLIGLLSRPWTGILLGSTLPIAGFFAATRLNEQFFPPADRDQFYIELELSPQSSIAQTEALARKIDERLKQKPRIRHTSWFMGESAPPFYYNIIARRKNNPNYGQAIVTLDSNRNSLGLIRELQLELDEFFPSARVLVRQLEQGPPFDAPVEVRLFGSDLEQLQHLGEELRAMATTVPHVLHARAMLSEYRPLVSIDVDSQQASWAGLSETDVAQQLYARLEGLLAGTVLEEVEEIPVRVRMASSSRASFENLRETTLMIGSNLAPTPSENGTPVNPSPAIDKLVPLSSIAAIHMKPQRSVITRYNGQRMNEVQSFITAGTLPSTVLGSVQRLLAQSEFEEQLPAGFRIEIGGEASERDAAVNRLMANVSILSVGMVAALVLALASFRLAALIGMVAVLSIGLGMGALWLFHYPFGFMAIVGTMGLIGIAINDSIVVVAALKENKLALTGDIPATVETIIEVTRHVLATTATTVVGFLPLLLSGGGFWPPVAVSIGAGVTGATLISLTLVPCAFRLMAPKVKHTHS